MPLALVDQKRQQVERPRARIAFVGVDVIGDVVVADFAANGIGATAEARVAVFAEQFEKAAPRLA